MTDDQILIAVKKVVREIAPEADLDTVPRDADLRQELDIDSMSFLNLAIGIEEQTGVSIPESDYARVTSLNDLLGYLRQKAA